MTDQETLQGLLNENDALKTEIVHLSMRIVRLEKAVRVAIELNKNHARAVEGLENLQKSFENVLPLRRK